MWESDLPGKALRGLSVAKGDIDGEWGGFSAIPRFKDFLPSALIWLRFPFSMAPLRWILLRRGWGLSPQDQHSRVNFTSLAEFFLISKSEKGLNIGNLAPFSLPFAE